MLVCNRIFVVIILLHLPGLIVGQNWNTILDHSDRYDEVIEKAEAIFNENGKGRGTGYKQYKRWRAEVENQIGPDNQLLNFGALNRNAYVRAQKKLSVSNQRSTHGEWINLGPFDYTVSDASSGGGIGRITQIEFDPFVNSTIWLGSSAAGLWKSTDSGITWTPKGDGFASMGVSDIKIHPTNPNIMYLLTGDGYNGHTFSTGVIKSTDGGNSWFQTGLEFTPEQKKRGYVMVMDPLNPNRLHAGFLGDGIRRSDDGGDTWTTVLPGWIIVWDIKYEPSDANIMYAATSDGLYRSINGGLHWFAQPDSDFPSPYGTGGFEKFDIAVCPSSPGHVYGIFGGDTGVNGMFFGLFKSTDYGNDFVLQSNTPNILGWNSGGNDDEDQAWRNLEIVVDPANSNKIYVGGINIWKSDNGGVNWERLTWFRRNDPEPYVHADCIELQFQGSTLFATNDGGVYKSTNAGGSWTELSKGLAVTQYYEIDVVGNKYMGGAQDNGTTESEYPNTQFKGILGGDGFSCVWHTTNNSIQYLSTQNSIIRKQSGFSTNISPFGLGTGDFWNNEMEMHTTNADYLFVATYDEMYRGDGDFFGFSWDSLGASAILVDGIRDFVQGTNDPNIMYITSKNIVLKTTNLGNSNPTWAPLELTLITSPFPTDVEVDPANANHVWVGMGGYLAGRKIYYSASGGASGTWQNVSGSLPNVPVNSLAYDPGSNNGIYVGTDIGVYYKNASMSDWIYFSNGFPNVRVFDMKVEGGYLYAGTFGRGIWRTPVYTSCPVSLVLTPFNEPAGSKPLGTQVYHTSNQITSTRIVRGGIGTDVSYHAGLQIDLLPGFEAHAGNLWKAKIEGCPD